MEIEHIIRYAPCAVGLKPPGYARRSPPARAMPDYVFKDHKPSRSAWKPTTGRPANALTCGLKPSRSAWKPLQGYGFRTLHTLYSQGLMNSENYSSSHTG